MFRKLLQHHDPGSIVVIILTFALFMLALFIKGLTHDLLLETGVFLVSVKLIWMSHKLSVAGQSMREQLQQIHDLVRAGHQQAAKLQ